nr:hypothetical protein [Oscillospiraceae bacterium]
VNLIFAVIPRKFLVSIIAMQINFQNLTSYNKIMKKTESVSILKRQKQKKSIMDANNDKKYPQNRFLRVFLQLFV